MIVTPPIYTPTHVEETEFLQSITEELMRKLIHNNNFLQDLAPIGTIIFVNSNQLGGGQPNLSFWQICDGSEITNANSPIRSIGLNLRYTPQMKNLYPCGAQLLSTNPTYGTHTHNLQHGHSTGGASAEGDGLRKKGSRNRRNPHGHTLASQYKPAGDGGTIVQAPAYVYLIAYMKIV